MTTTDPTPEEEQLVRDLPPVHKMRVDEITESDRNPRRIPERAVEILAESLRKFGWKQPLVVDKDRVLIVGHTRHRAARKIGLAYCPVIFADDLTPAEVDAYRIADNRTGDFTTWDLPALSVILADLDEEFAEVLALADWESAVAEVTAAGGMGDLDLPGDVRDALDGGFPVTVHFRTKEQALAAQEELLNIPGVFDVRHNR